MSGRVKVLCTCYKGKVHVIGEETCNTCMGLGRNLKSNCWAQPCTGGCNNGKKYYDRWVTCKSCNGLGYVSY